MVASQNSDGDNSRIVEVLRTLLEYVYRCEGEISPQRLLQIRGYVARRFGLSETPSVGFLQNCLRGPGVDNNNLPLLSSISASLRRKPVRTASGVAVVAVMCKPHRCPHQRRTGLNCTYCGGGNDSDFGYSSQSYTGYEPTSMRAIRARYDSLEQVRVRLEQLRGLSHSTDKVELILMGGTFMSLPRDYREQFISGIFAGLTGHVPYGDVSEGLGDTSGVPEALRYAARSSVKCVGLTIETRPDFCEPRHIAAMLRYACTRLEVGVQSVYADVIGDVNRGHTIQGVRRCFGQSRDAGFKMTAHMMPNLPFTSFIRDAFGFRELFESADHRPDGLKIYPTLVLRGTLLYDRWRRKMFTSFHTHTLVSLIALLLRICPPWTRVYRVMRDIPLPLVSSGAETSNLREQALDLLRSGGRPSVEIRQREAGIGVSTAIEMEKKATANESAAPTDVADAAEKKKCSATTANNHSSGCCGGSDNCKSIDQDIITNSNNSRGAAQGIPEIIRRDYWAGGGWETFLSVEAPAPPDGVTPPPLLGLLRLRCVPRGGGAEFLGLRPELQGAVSLVRELHVYGEAAAVNVQARSGSQHRGIGRLLVAEAEKIALAEHGSAKLAIIAGVGTREYYAKLGYALDGPYMSRMLRKRNTI